MALFVVRPTIVIRKPLPEQQGNKKMKNKKQLILTGAVVSMLGLSSCAHNNTDNRERGSNYAMNHETNHSRIMTSDSDYAVMTSYDQGNSRADKNTTARIRRDIVANDSISVNARNVNITTNQGRVTLRGWVYTSKEKNLIHQIANRYAGSSNVYNQLVIKK
jgi:hyperosmotically inducible periplasmic protein